MHRTLRTGLLCLVSLGLWTLLGTNPARAAGGEAWQPAPSGVVAEVTGISQTVLDGVGLQPDVTPPVILRGQHRLTLHGKPEIFYLGSEPCPFCAAQRWAFVIALARFGSWSHLGITESAKDDVDPSTATFSFSHARFVSPYVSVVTVEHLSSKKVANGQYATLQPISPAENRLYKEYTSAKYFPGNAGSLPFQDFANRVVMSSSNFDPDILHGLSAQAISADLSDSSSPVTRHILATANYLTAATCLVDGARPASVCHSPGVVASAHFDKLSYGGGGGSCLPASGVGPACSAPSSSK
jgi:Domain of unknown function (DUF929)